MKVSIVMGAYNAEPFIEKSITSVLSQTHEDFELLIADDGSTDNTRSVIDNFATEDSRIRTSHNRTNQGILRTRNRLFGEATGRFVTLLDADDWLAPQKLERQVNYLNETNAESCGTNYYKVHVDGRMELNSEGRFDAVLGPKDIHDLPFWLPNIMMRHSFLKRVGGYDTYFEDFACFEDLYWTYDILDSAPVVFLNEPLYYRQHNPSSLTKTLNLRRLASLELVLELIQQRRNTGTDWLKQGNRAEADSFISSLLADKRWRGEQYRTYSAIKTDEGRFAEAASFLTKAMSQNPGNRLNLNTLLYLARSAILRLSRSASSRDMSAR